MGRIKKKRGRPSNYLKSLKNNDYWNEVRRKIKIRDKHQCKVCGAKTRLEIHHITYSINGQSILGKEKDYLKYLITLCESHHQEVHSDLNHPLNPKNNKYNAKTHQDLP